MSKKIFITLFLLVLCVSVSSAQTVSKQWEYLEVSQVKYNYSYSNEQFPYRSYNFFNLGKVIAGGVSLEWIGKSGWELVGAIPTGENNLETKLIFKRPYNEQISKRDIEELEKSFKEQKKTPPAELIDLDVQEAKQRLDDFNRQEEERLRNVLSKLNDSTIKFFTVKSAAYELNKTNLVAEIVVDGTSTLLKDGNKYRSSEAKSYLQEVAKQVSDLSDLNIFSFIQNRFQIGKLSGNNGNITIGITVIVNYKKDQIILAQEIAYGSRKEVKP